MFLPMWAYDASDVFMTCDQTHDQIRNSWSKLVIKTRDQTRDQNSWSKLVIKTRDQNSWSNYLKMYTSQ